LVFILDLLSVFLLLSMGQRSSANASIS